MKRKVGLLTIITAGLFSVSCVAPMRLNSFPIEQQISEGKIKFKGGDGTSVGNAVVVKGATDEHEAMQAEMYFISGIYGVRDGDWTLTSMGTIRHGRRLIDDAEFLVAKSNTTIHMYFDVSANYDLEDRYYN